MNCLGDSLQDGTGFSLREELLAEDLVKQLPALHELCDDKHLVSIVKHLQKTKYALMSDLTDLAHKFLVKLHENFLLDALMTGKYNIHFTPKFFHANH